MEPRLTALGHVVLRVRDLERSLKFYRDFLGLKEIARLRRVMVFLGIPGSGNHHDLALLEVGMEAPPPDPRAAGLYHVAFKAGNSLEELRIWRDRVEREGWLLIAMSDHKVSQSLYVADPDGIEIELYVDADPASWASDPQAVATLRPLRL